MKFEDMINNVILGDCYEVIKNIPDKSIDCVYVDVPYLYKQGGAGTSEIAKRATKNKIELMGTINDYDPKLSNKENLRIAKNKKNSVKEYIDISNGFDYKLFIR